MNKLLTALVIGSMVLFAACKDAADTDKVLEGKKAELARLQDQQDKLTGQITSLEKEIAKMDTSANAGAKPKLVALTPLAPTSFTHYIDLQGNVDANDLSYVAPRNGTGGVVKTVFVKQGEHVHKGQLLVKLDDAVQRQQLANAETQLSYAKDLYQRRKNLWDEKIGAEVDVINAKNSVDMAQNQVKLLQEQLDFTNVTADIDGTVDNITVKVGEMFSAGQQQIRIVNTDNLKVVVQVPEIYQQRVKVGTAVRIALPGLDNKVISGTVHVAGKVIDPGSRSFTAEIRIPGSSNIRANQIAVVKLEDYSASKVLTVPVNTVQSDEKGKYVMVGVKENGKLVAHKKSITIGQLYNDQVEVAGGLQAGDQLITDGFQGLYEGQMITTQ
ncbi:MAG: efflux RND transporter periplasmic adaptor subunit [Bacteroidota bacterium]|nr:efflux RND transporter periplasmic adaptor subunit [Bacteroidota bacterium]MDP4218151.1 efflux RND transporter periplasmic adaptor subunit [Bacteroidota bacterium]MDP4246793.1 efflux RND transporter periplasmic adaptor subunit [Bacteroidota bacterium]MDP4258381.1 efflux RND transporter periplasmic adaptor subunit [Bacteroidota bacterium]